MVDLIYLNLAKDAVLLRTGKELKSLGEGTGSTTRAEMKMADEEGNYK